MVIDLNAKHRRIKVLEEKQGDVGPGCAQKVPPVKENKNDPLDCIKCQTSVKTRNFCSTNHIANKGVVTRTRKDRSKLNCNKTHNPNRQ